MPDEPFLDGSIEPHVPIERGTIASLFSPNRSTAHSLNLQAADIYILRHQSRKIPVDPLEYISGKMT
jgi:hypothetical protein